MPKREKPMPERFWEDNQWTIDHYDELAHKYADEWVAVVNKTVVASGESIGEVKRKAERKTGEKHIPVMFIEKGVHIYANFLKVWS